MKIELFRDQNQRSPIATEGHLYIDGVLICDTLEDQDRDKNRNGQFDAGEQKIAAETCIPIGTHKVIMAFSPAHQKMMPLLIGVPQFSGVEIHAGITTADTKGCILVGTRSTIPGELKHGTTQPARDQVYKLIQEATDRKEEIEIEIKYQEQPELV